MGSSGRDDRPTIIALAGSNGAGKSTFYETKLAQLGWSFINADLLAKARGIDPYAAAEVAHHLRCDAITRGESFIFETVLSDPHGEKVEFLKQTAGNGYNVILCFIAIRDPELSIQRVGMRVSQGGHDVPTDKLYGRHGRTLENLKRAIRQLPVVRIYDNTVLADPYHHAATFHCGKPTTGRFLLTEWLAELLTAEFYSDV
jgi:predicted ABC-type ATPase